MTPPPPTLRLAFDHEALAYNWRALDRLSGTAMTGAAVKADAYGIGAARAVPVLAAAGCQQFYVAHWSEVCDVLPHVPASRISVLHGPMNATEAAFARQTGVRPVINSLAQGERWLATGGGPCDLMVDTGMNRLGLALNECGDPRLAQLNIDTLMSHLACADENSSVNAAQQAEFAAVSRNIPHARASLANSAGIALGRDYHFDLTRPGLAIYGGIPRGELAGIIRPVVVPEAAVIQLRSVSAGDRVGYGGTFTAERETRVGILSLGYADGYLRSWSRKGAFTFGGKILPVLGRVSMDMTAIDCTSVPALREGDWVAAQYDLPDAAQQSGLSQYELLTMFGRRLRA